MSVHQRDSSALARPTSPSPSMSALLASCAAAEAVSTPPTADSGSGPVRHQPTERQEHAAEPPATADREAA